jgi:serine/threonine protein kinase
MMLGDQNRYKVICHLGDGTFGRALKCQDLQSNMVVAVKVIRAVKRYTESAKIEAEILNDLKKKGGDCNYIVDLKESFVHRNLGVDNICLVFEPLGKSLFDFIKENGYRGFEIGQVQSIAYQSLKALEFLHTLKLTHTDLKPENILLKNDEPTVVTNES